MKKIRLYDEFHALTTHYRKKNPGYFSMPHCPLTKEIIQPLQRAYKNVNIDSGKLASVTSYHVLRLIKRYQQMLKHSCYTTTTANQVKAIAIADFVWHNFREKSVEDIPAMASHFGLSITHFNRLSVIAFNQPIRRQVIMLRMDYAMELLTSSNHSISQIALLAGYSDGRYFSKAFKKHFKNRPSEFRSLTL